MENKILLVDDDDLFLSSLAMFLKSEGYMVTALDNGISAIDKVKQDFYPVVILDVMMPDINGIEVLKKIREIQKGKMQSKVIIITGFAKESLQLEAKRCGANEFMFKPFQLSDLIDSVKVNMKLAQKQENIQG